MPMAEIDGVRIHYHDAGKGPAIILITPPLLTRAIFRYQTEELSDAFRVVTFDIRGHGLSGRSASPVTYSLISEDVCRLMDFLGIRQALIGGYSTGAGVALETLLKYPDRFHGGILLSGMPEMSDWYNRSRLKAATTLCSMGAKKLLAWAICRGNSDCPETFGRLYHEAMRGNTGNWREYYVSSGEYRCTAWLGRIHHPVLLVYGKKDHGFHRYARMLERELLQAELIMLEDVSHQLPTKAPAAVNRLIREFAARVLPHDVRNPWGTQEANREKTEKDLRAPFPPLAGDGAEQPETTVPPG